MSIVARRTIYMVLGWFTLLAGPLLAAPQTDFQQAVEKDWARQERRLGRTPARAETIRAVYARGVQLLDCIGAMPDAPDLADARRDLASLESRVRTAEGASANERKELYLELRWLVRDIALKNPLFAGRRIAFMERHRFICQMLHEYLGYYYDYGDIDGGGVYVLEEPGRTDAHSNLIQERLPRGNFATLALSYDAQTLYFAFAARNTEKRPDYYASDRTCFHIYAMDSDGANLRALTHGTNDYFDPCPLPDGGIAFMCTRRGGFTRCNNPWEPLPAHTLHRMDADGANVRTLSFHETSEWHPNVLHDGRIVYTRWDYVDRSAAHFHGLWLTNPDGSGVRALFGNYTQRINACYQAHPIPGSRKIAFLAGAHHANVGGSLVLLDPDRVGLDPETGEDRFDAIESITPEVCFPEAPDWPASYFHSPWPLSEDFFLISFSFDPLPGMGPGTYKDTETGLYLLDRFGNMELLYRHPGISAMYPIPIEPRPAPPAVPSTCDPELGDEGEFMLAHVQRSLYPMATDAPITELRIFQVLPKSETHVANQPRIGYANAESARLLLGTVPVETDGSAYFRAPAGKPLAFQAVGADGRAVQGMRSVAYLQPGERRSCVGCHEGTGDVSAASQTLAMRRPPSRIEPGPDGSNPWSFQRLVQPVLDQHCVRCHDGGESNAAPDLRAQLDGEFTTAYRNLKPHVRWYEWGDHSIRVINSIPGEMPSTVSPLADILADATHAAIVLPREAAERLNLWMDANGAFYGSYSTAERRAQIAGQIIPVPAMQ